MGKLLVIQLIVHLLADFHAQPEGMCNGKRTWCLRSWHIYVHAIITGAMAWTMVFRWDFAFFALVVALSHLLVDTLKTTLENRKNLHYHPTIFTLDQLLHLLAIYGVVRWYWGANSGVDWWFDRFSLHALLMVACGILCLKPANVMIRCCLIWLKYLPEKEQGQDEFDEKELQEMRAGRWIGCLERILTYALTMLGAYAAIGFIIAAKSIVRYGEHQKGRAEYVLIGTLLSFGLAVMVAIGVGSGIFETILTSI